MTAEIKNGRDRKGRETESRKKMEPREVLLLGKASVLRLELVVALPLLLHCVVTAVGRGNDRG